jgi:hypothetical protein
MNDIELIMEVIGVLDGCGEGKLGYELMTKWKAMKASMVELQEAIDELKNK